MPVRSRRHALGPFLRHCDLCQVLLSFISAITIEEAGFSEVSVHCYRILGLTSQKRRYFIVHRLEDLRTHSMVIWIYIWEWTPSNLPLATEYSELFLDVFCISLQFPGKHDHMSCYNTYSSVIPNLGSSPLESHSHLKWFSSVLLYTFLSHS